MRSLKLKRLFDILFSLLILVFMSPILFFTALAIYLEDGGPVLFKQKRVGLYGKEFTIIKFRSMKINDIPPEEMGQVNEKHPLVTKVGRIIRKFHIDEIPQLFNVLKGDMSIVGPRATLTSQVKNYNNYQRLRLKMKPGITGWAQINGNTLLDWNDRIKLDVWYVMNWNIILDFYIMIKTFNTLLFGEYINEKALKEAIEYENSISRSC